ncbi:hypothetical protein F2P56_015403 [Juglans regia]|uniref:Uncharacterized protein LOC109005458 n=2 Tax=Juglans regia TaxID=51240 RepID=A0A2I4G7T6_JUGRE|nr:uncharacterized protein LOC109005458 [Juglans regia]KAF5465390.1 hypothetical protein F2P56_015403 [Juglans regia]
MKTEIKKFIKEYEVCQRNKVENVHPAGLLHPLKVPQVVWTDISMGFVVGLPMSEGYSVVMVIVDRLSKYVHFLPLKHPFTTVKVASVFLDHVFKLHGMPKSIISDRGSTFLSSFWKEFFKLQGVNLLAYSSAYHPQSDGQTEAVNKCLEQFLRFFSVYGVPPTPLRDYVPGLSSNHVVEELLKSHEHILDILKTNMLLAQKRMKFQYDKQHTERTFAVRDWVAYCLELPPQSQLHLVFHVSCLKKKVGQHISPLTTLPPVNVQGEIAPEPQNILQHLSRKVNNRAMVEVLVQWVGTDADQATWEPYWQLRHFPHLVGKVL